MTLRTNARVAGITFLGYFGAGSTIFCWLPLRGRMIPAALGWLGVVASALLVVLLLLQRGGQFSGPLNWSSTMTWLVWLPLLIFELTFASWLIVKGTAVPQPARVR